MNEVYSKHVGERPPARSTVEVAKLPSGALVEIEAIALARSKAIEEYVRSLGLDAYVVGGAVRDELLGRDSKDADFLVPATDIAGLRAALEPHGRTEELVVAGRPVGVRFFPRDRAIRRSRERASSSRRRGARRRRGPAVTTSRSSSTRRASVEDDLYRRDFTINAMARRLADGELVDPYGGRATSRRGVLRTVSPTSFAEDPLRIMRGLRFVSQLDLDPDAGDARADAGARRPASRLVSGERIGGGLAADGMGELSKLLLGARAARRRSRLARDTGVLVALAARVRAGDRVRPGEPRPRDDGRRAHLRGRPGCGRRGRVARACGSRRSSTTSASRTSPGAAGTAACTTTRSRALAKSHEQVGAELADAALAPAALPERAARAGRAHRALAHVRHSARPTPLRARRLLARYGEGLLVRSARPQGGRPARERATSPRDATKLERARALPRVVTSSELASPHRLSDLAVDGDRPDRARLPARAGARAHAARRCSTRSSTTRR